MAGLTLYDLELSDPADPGTFFDHPVTTNADGEAWIGPSQLAASALQQPVERWFHVVTSFPAGSFQVALEVVSIATGDVLGSGTAQVQVVHTSSFLDGSVQDVSSQGRGLLELSLRVSTAEEPTEPMVLRYFLQTDQGTAVPGATFYFDPASSGSGGHETWTNSCSTDAQGEALDGRSPSASFFQVRGTRTLYTSLGALPQGSYLLTVSLERASDGALLESLDIPLTSD
jgi:hypothetical protein